MQDIEHEKARNYKVPFLLPHILSLLLVSFCLFFLSCLGAEGWKMPITL